VKVLIILKNGVWIAIHKCMEATLGISLYSYLYTKLAKRLSFLLSLMFSLQQNQRRGGWNRFCLEMEGLGEVTRVGDEKDGR
jgi:hypothetical protein